MKDRRKDDPWRHEVLEKIKDIHTCVYGNGSDGIKTTVGKHGVYIKVLCGASSLIIIWIVTGILF